MIQYMPEDEAQFLAPFFLPPDKLKYRIVSRADLPARMKQEYLYPEAYALCCDWNVRHSAEFMAFAEKVTA